MINIATNFIVPVCNLLHSNKGENMSTSYTHRIADISIKNNFEHCNDVRLRDLFYEIRFVFNTLECGLVVQVEKCNG